MYHETTTYNCQLYNMPPFLPHASAQESPRIVSYDLTVQIDVPNRQVEVGGSFEVDFHDSDSISLVLWRHARIDTLRHSSREITYRFDTLAPAPAQFIPDGRTLTLYRPAGADDRCRINTRYTLYMQEVQGLQNHSMTIGLNLVTIRDGILSATVTGQIIRTYESASLTVIR